MKFTPKETFQHTPQNMDKEAARGFPCTWDEGNTYDTEANGSLASLLTQAEVEYFRANGWAEVEGMDPAPARSTEPVELVPETASHSNASEVDNG